MLCVLSISASVCVFQQECAVVDAVVVVLCGFFFFFCMFFFFRVSFECVLGAGESVFCVCFFFW